MNCLIPHFLDRDWMPRRSAGRPKSNPLSWILLRISVFCIWPVWLSIQTNRPNHIIVIITSQTMESDSWKSGFVMPSHPSYSVLYANSSLSPRLLCISLTEFITRTIWVFYQSIYLYKKIWIDLMKTMSPPWSYPMPGKASCSISYVGKKKEWKHRTVHLNVCLQHSDATQRFCTVART